MPMVLPGPLCPYLSVFPNSTHPLGTYKSLQVPSRIQIEINFLVFYVSHLSISHLALYSLLVFSQDTNTED